MVWSGVVWWCEVGWGGAGQGGAGGAGAGRGGVVLLCFVMNLATTCIVAILFISSSGAYKSFTGFSIGSTGSGYAMTKACLLVLACLAVRSVVPLITLNQKALSSTLLTPAESFTSDTCT